jgi:hypothetical protein
MKVLLMFFSEVAVEAAATRAAGAMAAAAVAAAAAAAARNVFKGRDTRHGKEK